MEEPLLNANCITLEWTKIFYSLPAKKKTILNGVSGSAKCGEITVIMGPSGSGKTSLLNVLACRIQDERNVDLQGKVFVNQKRRNEKTFTNFIGYVEQQDSLFPFLTVVETLSLAAKFNGNNVNIQHIIFQMSLEKSQNTMVGNEKVRGLSGGEKKRVAIAVQLLKNPTVLLLDEPTSGLDSFQALVIFQNLQNLAKLGQTIIASIHQPSSILMQKIDNLVLLSEGYTVYSGPYQDVLCHFEYLGFVCQSNYNPAEFILDLVSIDYSSEEQRNASETQIQKLVTNWRTQETFYSTEVICNLYPTAKHSNSSFSLLLWRSWVNSIRNTFAFKIKLGTSIFFALVLGAIYSKSTNDQSGIQDKIGILFFISINMAFSNVIGIINLFVHEKLLVQKEIKSGFYSLPAYYISKILIEIPFTLISPIIFSLIIYWMVGLNSQIDCFFMFLLIIIIESIVAMFMGIFVSGLSSSIEIATAIAPPLNIVFFMFAGVFINLKNLPKWLQFFPKISFIHWVFESLAINQFKGQTFECNSGSKMCLHTGDQVLQMYSLTDSLNTCLLSLSGIGIVFLCLGYFALWWTSPRYRQLLML